MIKFNGVCPFCRSEETQIEDSGSVVWDDGNHGTTDETWRCRECGRYFGCHARVDVTHRECAPAIFCPYCCDGDVDMKDQQEGNQWYWCESCQREFAVHPENWYHDLVVE